MVELLASDLTIPTLLLVLFVFGFAPGAALRLLVRLYPMDDPRRQELVAEVYAVPRLERPFWVVEQLEIAISEGLTARIRRIREASRRRRSSVRVWILIQAAWSVIVNAISWAWSAVVQVVATSIGRSASAIGSAWQGVVQVVATSGDRAVSAIDAPWQMIVQAVVRLAARIDADHPDDVELIYAEYLYGIRNLATELGQARLRELTTAVGFLWRVALSRRVSDGARAAISAVRLRLPR